MEHASPNQCICPLNSLQDGVLICYRSTDEAWRAETPTLHSAPRAAATSQHLSSPLSHLKHKSTNLTSSDIWVCKAFDFLCSGLQELIVFSETFCWNHVQLCLAIPFDFFPKASVLSYSKEPGQSWEHSLAVYFS